jgi:hypothetical protein
MSDNQYINAIIDLWDVTNILNLANIYTLLIFSFLLNVHDLLVHIPVYSFIRIFVEGAQLRFSIVATIGPILEFQLS